MSRTKKKPTPIPDRLLAEHSNSAAGELYDCAVIGAGPAGLLSALYLRRFRRSTLVFNCGRPRASWIPKIHNLIGIERPTSGRRILGNLQKQLGELNTSVIAAEVRVERARDHFVIRSEGAKWHVKRVILATGVTDDSPDFKNLVELREKAVLGYCPICDGYDHCGQSLALFAESTHGLAKIPFLCGYTDEIHVFQTRKFKVSAYHRHLIKKQKIHVHHEPIESIEVTENPKGLRVHCRGKAPIQVDFGYVSMGVQVNDQAFRHLKSLKRTKDGFIIVNSLQQTSIKGMFAAGDCVNELFQVSVAAGHAAVAATEVHNSLF
jgi:thioredoxin reductase (NADPH)